MSKASSSQPAMRRCLAVVAAWAMVCAPATGCRTLSRRGPVSQSVATARQLTQQGINAMERGDWKRAETLLSRAVESSPTDPEARRNYAEALCHRGAMPEALLQLEESRKLTSEDPALAVRTGEVYFALARMPDASRMVEESLRLDPKFATAWSLRGKIAAANGQARQALADYQRALGYAPDDQQIVLLVAETYRQLNEPERALVALQSVAESYSPGSEPQQVLYLQGLALSALARYDDAARSLSRAAHRDRPSAEILCRLAEVEMLAGRPAAAQATIRQALALDPNHPAARNVAARIAAAPAADTVRR